LLWIGIISSYDGIYLWLSLCMGVIEIWNNLNTVYASEHEQLFFQPHTILMIILIIKYLLLIDSNALYR
jgi:hypothetical protein